MVPTLPPSRRTPAGRAPLSRSKRAQAVEGGFPTTIYYAIVFIVGAVFLLYAFGVFDEGSKSQFDDAHCKLSVASAAALHLTGINGLEANIRCPTKNVTIKTDDPEKTNAQIADAMRGCWSNWWQGEHELFSSDGTFCNVCSILVFKPKTGSIQGLDRYLLTATLPGGNITYADYLMAYKTAQADEFVRFIDKSKIESKEMPRSETYAVMYVHIRGSDNVKTMFRKLATTGTGTAAIGGGLAVVFTSSTIATAIGGTVLGAVFAPVIATVGAGIALVGGTVFILTAGTTAFDAPPDHVAQIFFVKYTPQTITEIGCENSPGG